MKYNVGDKLLVGVTVLGNNIDNVVVETESRRVLHIIDKDVHSTVLQRFNVGDNVTYKDKDEEYSGIVEAITYEHDPPQAWIKSSSHWPLRTVLVRQLRRQEQ